ncbi:MAG: DNA-3-methyladenine glycosylase 2 [Oscillospiraceae bacterium]|jgi:N-glycosylase/DNA lyase|nr:DNA-3-methyladenine glycosylase 2 [Oscillospiraceae bacterium]
MLLEIECNLAKTLTGGQAFRWEQTGENVFRGYAFDRYAEVSYVTGGIEIMPLNDNANDVGFWENYFDVSRDYDGLIKQISGDSTIQSAATEHGVIRILRQSPFETLLSFIISQNNNIPRIKGIISRLCDTFGTDGAFPTPEQLHGAATTDFRALGMGFRDKYITDALTCLETGIVNLSDISRINPDTARETLKQIKGVGDKVADCVLLFGFGLLTVFPKDVWIKRITAEHYPNGLPDCWVGAEGLAQQYLFEGYRK